MWQAPISKQQKSDNFLEGRFGLASTAPDYHDHVLNLSKRAEVGVGRFLAVCGVTSSGPGAVLKYLRALYRSGDLNAKIERYQRLL
ncbi:hypothetical protein PF005_g2922 [Phytophthora fragariae]|uniref:Uncharacterized protein n=1 Tax=Phytophthora fragariae TaxID=53985 RepID=A0A6A4A779_9STRA|nr:hypothetical protein PF003_g13806 [Phytophthora fragariae]KAE8947329.1 hypothetical protein PF009_g3079 [Phytophthora fragariae]KAE9009137.1 hypothetical protein PF011_g10411 [Phytophthora fragariae]KAE9086759.1 hypothetical protein PF010_g19970 [Phytophthora fragariae]KAE9139708.1 hypothetical protein PF007_g900 [Phytophthora fragariae]